MIYLIVPLEFAQALDGQTGIESKFGYAKLKDGRYACPSKLEDSFPAQFEDLFSSSAREEVDLEPNDFELNIQSPE